MCTAYMYTNEWMDGWMDGLMDGRTDRKNASILLHELDLERVSYHVYSIHVH